MTTCRCGRTTRDDAWLCETCTDRLAADLGDVAWLAEELEITITKVRGAPTEGGSRSAETALPWHDAASEAQRHLRGLLHAWVRFCHEDQVRSTDPRHQLPEDTLPAMARWLLWRVDGLALLDIGPEAHDEITDAVADCRRIIDRKPERWYAGPCDECGADLYAKAKRGTVTCRQCELEYDIEARRQWLLAAAEDRLADAATVARAMSWLGAEPLTSARVRKWAERDRLVARGHDGRSPLYRIGDAIDLLAGEARRAETRRSA